MHEEREQTLLCQNIKREYETYKEAQDLSQNINCVNGTNDNYREDQDPLALQDPIAINFGLLKKDIKKEEDIEDEHSLQEETSAADLQHTSGESECEDTDNIKHNVGNTELSGRRILSSSGLTSECRPDMHVGREQILLYQNIKREYVTNNEYKEDQDLNENIKCENEANDDYRGNQDHTVLQDHFALQVPTAINFGLLKKDIKKEEVIEDEQLLQDEISAAVLQRTSGESECEDTDNIRHNVDNTELLGRRILRSSRLFRNDTPSNNQETKQFLRLEKRNSSALSEFQQKLNKKIFEENTEMKSKKLYFRRNRKKYTCHDCDKNYSRLCNLTDHITSAHLKIKNYQCVKCNKMYFGYSDFKKHSCSVGGKIIHKCNMCNIKFSKPSYLEQHKVIHEEKKFICDNCGERFLKFSILKNHIIAVNCQKRSETSNKDPSSYRNKVYACCNCGRRYFNIYTVKRHIVIVHSGIGDFKCIQCNETFSQSYDLKKVHTCPVQNFSEKYECQVCNRQFSNPIGLRLHSFVHIERKYICADCDKRFVAFSDIKNHIKVMHYKKESGSSKETNTHKPYACEICDDRYSWINDLQSHITVAHLGVGYYKCVACSKLFLKPRKIKKHLQVEHRYKELNFEENSKKYACGECDKQYNGFIRLHDHIKTIHLRMDIYKCSRCMKSYSSLSTFQRHIKTEKHKNFNKFVCDICKKKFWNLPNLERHINNIHSKTKKFCEYCAKSYYKVHSLNRHINVVHNKIRNFECHVCNKKFNRRHQLETHITCVHEKAKNFVCEQCGGKFSLAHGLKKHVNEVHKGI